MDGPRLCEVSYPDVLVALARSDGDDLRLVLHPGGEPGSQRLAFDRLCPGRRYAVTVQGNSDAEVIEADHTGRARTDVLLRDRTVVALSPTP